MKRRHAEKFDQGIQDYDRLTRAANRVFEAVAPRHPEAWDTAVREYVYDALESGQIPGDHPYEDYDGRIIGGHYFGMFSTRGNNAIAAQVRRELKKINR